MRKLTPILFSLFLNKTLYLIQKWLVGAVVVFAGLSNAQATTLLSVADSASTPNIAWEAGISDKTYWAASWTQSVASTNTQVSAAVFYQPLAIQDYSVTAYLMRALGPTATAADIVASTSLVTPDIGLIDIFNYSSASNTTFFSGLDLSAGTYFLLLAGADSDDWAFVAQWLGAPASSADISGMPGFSAGPSYAAGGWLASVVDPPWQAEFVESQAPFSDETFNLYLRVSGQEQVVPEPPVLPLLAFGLLITALGRRRTK